MSETEPDWLVALIQRWGKAHSDYINDELAHGIEDREARILADMIRAEVAEREAGGCRPIRVLEAKARAMKPGQTKPARKGRVT